MKLKTGLLTAAMLTAPGAALACGGLFCNNSQPVTQSAERILFAQDGDTVHMHVRLSYAGPPQDFGWLLPVPPDVETALSSETLFQQFDQQFGPRFAVQTEFHENCNQGNFRGGPVLAGSDQDDGAEFSPAPKDPGVQIISREAVGPYDRVILHADNVQVLRTWLDENEFQVPEKTDATLIPYIENGAVFVALKLLPGTDAGDVQPLRLKFTAPSATIPIVPTSVAASPDMGIIVHILGQSRAIPKNYAHIQINDAAIDWFNGGQNYADVVSKAADDAMGKAFATDYAGTSAGIIDFLPLINERTLDQVRGMETVGDLINNVPLDADLGRVLGDSVKIPEGVSPTQFWQCPQCFDGIDFGAAIDGEAIAAQIEVEINAPRKELAKLFGDNPYLSRLYTTLSAAEMDLDPVFAFNPDLDDVNNRYTATQKIFCDSNGEILPSLTYLETPSGIRMPVSDNTVPDPIARQDGATVRGIDMPGARIIEQIAERGQPMVIEDLTRSIRARYNDDVAQPSVGGGGCQSTDAPASLAGLFGLLVVVFRRRR